MLDSNKIRILVKTKGFNKDEFAEMLGYTYSGFNKALNRGYMKDDKVTKIADILGVSKTELYKEDFVFNEDRVDYKLKQKVLSLEEKVKDQHTIISRQDELISMYKKQIKDKEC